MTVRKGSGNVFLDIGFDAFEAEELAVKADLISMIGLAIARRKLTQKEAAALCGTHQASLSKVLSGKLGSVTMDQLTKWLIALGGDVEICASAPRKAGAQKRGSLSFHAGN